MMKIMLISDRPDKTKALAKALSEMITPAPQINFCSTANSKNKLLTDKPSVVVLDCASGGIVSPAEYVSQLAPKYYVPIIAVSREGADRVALLKAGVLDIIIRKIASPKDDERFLQQLVNSIENIYRTLNDNLNRKAPTASSKIIAVGGSTGSTNSLPVILKELTADCPPIVCVLHMPEGYTNLYAQQLNSTLMLEVKEAKSGEYLKNGQVIIAAGAKHLRVYKDSKGYFIKSEAGPKVDGHCPSVNALFDSVAVCAGKNAIGVILTGMGSDGTSGMINMRKAGAYNIAEDETTAVVYGMPKSAFEAGAANMKCPLHEIAKNIMRLK